MSLSPTRIFGHGVDLALISRFVSTYDKYGDRFLAKALHPREIAHFHSISDINLARARFLASRWALKEAVIKASGKRLLFPEMYTTTNKPHDPRLQLVVEGLSLSFFKLNNLSSVISVTHDGDYAMASVILQQDLSPSACNT